MFTGLQIINPNIIEKKRKNFQIRDFFESILKKKSMVLLMIMIGITLVIPTT